ncbi:hypothetical protein GCM10011320_23650 [Neoroseomonas lacus]|uniref:Uncharacterized protein n=1 Tax=Neoroseomonas lacus TaxID=287609 RepID=A0A917KL03_9PROT|nr:hypothetical protein GCM10011320_23650 [Neoroseomonas lacus]
MPSTGTEPVLAAIAMAGRVTAAAAIIITRRIAVISIASAPGTDNAPGMVRHARRPAEAGRPGRWIRRTG